MAEDGRARQGGDDRRGGRGGYGRREGGDSGRDRQDRGGERRDDRGGRSGGYNRDDRPRSSEGRGRYDDRPRRTGDNRGGYQGNRDDRPKRSDDDRPRRQFGDRDDRPRQDRDDRPRRQYDDRGGRGGYQGDRAGSSGSRDDRSGRGGYQGGRGTSSGSRDDRGGRGGYQGSRGESSGSRDDRGGRGGYQGDRGARSGPREDRGGRGGYQGSRDDRPRQYGDRDNRPSQGRDDRPRRTEGRDERPRQDRDDRARRSYGSRDDRPRQDRDDRPRRQYDDRGGRGGSRDDRPRRDRDDRPGGDRRQYDRRDDRPRHDRDDRVGHDGKPARGRDALRPLEEREAGHEGPIRIGETGEAPDLPEGLEYGFDQLDKETKAGLRSLNKQLAEAVGNRLIATAALLAEDDIQGALVQARYARRKASRVAIVREVTGVAAYGAGEWQLAMNELRAAQRLGGTHDHIAMIADCERATGHPDRAIDLYREYGDDKSIDPEVRVELLIVASGARRDMGMGEAATAMLKVGALKSPKTEPWVARLRYAYAEGLLADGREDEAREWLSKAVAADEAGETGAAERLLELEGVDFEEIEDELDDDLDDDLDEEDDEDDFDDEDEDEDLEEEEPETAVDGDRQAKGEPTPTPEESHDASERRA